MLTSAAPSRSVFTRRRFLRNTGVAGIGGLLAWRARSAGETVRLPFDNGDRPLVQYPQKRPLIRITTRPPQLETPFSVFNEGILTPNDAFFVRYHLSEIPLEIDPDSFSLEIKGSVTKPLKLTLANLRTDFETFELVAVNQCSGNGRGFFTPRVGGGQMGNGAMGNARWKGARLKDVLDKAGVKASAKQVTFKGLDRPVVEKIPEFVKALNIDHARDGEVMIAWEMNGSELPMLNGYPLRLVVPGYYGTYWIKHLNEIAVVDDVFSGFWMQAAYRIPDNETASVPPGTVPAKTIPIQRFNVRSFITSLADGATLTAGRTVEIQGIAFDGGAGIKQVQFTSDGGRTWVAAQLGRDEGRYSFRKWSASFAPTTGPGELRCRATNNRGETQPLEALWNPAGYMRNVVESVRVKVV